MGRPLRMWKFVEFRTQACKLPTSVAHSPLPAHAPVGGMPTLRYHADPRLKELVGLNAKERGDPIEVFELQPPAFVEKFVHPRFPVPTPLRKGFLILMARVKQGSNVLA